MRGKLQPLKIFVTDFLNVMSREGSPVKAPRNQCRGTLITRDES